MLGERTLTTFKVMNLSAISRLTMNGSNFIFTIKLERISTSIIITTFLQTFVLWFLVYLTLFIDVKDFNNRNEAGVILDLLFVVAF